MISYKEWKQQQQFAEADAGLDQNIKQLVQSTAQDIVQTVQAYIDLNQSKQPAPERNSPQQQPTPEAPEHKAGPIERLGRGVDNAGRAIGRAVTPDLNAPVKGNLLPSERGQDKRPTRLDRLRTRMPAAASLLTPQPGEENKPWYKKLWGRLNNAASNFQKAMRKEDVDKIFPAWELKEVLAEHGVKRLFLVEANGDFDKLGRAISAHLLAFADGLKRLSGGGDSAEPASQQQQGPMPVPGEPTDISSSEQSPEKAAPDQPAQESDPLKAAKQAMGPRGRASNLRKFLAVMGVDAEDEAGAKKAVTALINTLGFGKGKRAIVTDILKTGGFPDEVKHAIRSGGVQQEKIETPIGDSEPKETPTGTDSGLRPDLGDFVKSETPDEIKKRKRKPKT